MNEIHSTNLRLNMGKESHRKAWEYLQTMDKGQYKSYSNVIALALVEFFERKARLQEDPYFETREREERFIRQIVREVEKALDKVLPAYLAGIISGVSGAGRTPNARTHYCHANESVEAYGVAKHRHTPEIEQTLSGLAGSPVDVVFTPHLAPLTRGLLATVYLQVASDVTADQVQAIYQDRYAAEKLVTMLPAGKMPQTGSVAGSGRAQVGVALDARRQHVIIASCAIDNLGKGAASQAVQAANIVFGLPETQGLDFTAPVV